MMQFIRKCIILTIGYFSGVYFWTERPLNRRMPTKTQTRRARWVQQYKNLKLGIPLPDESKELIKMGNLCIPRADYEVIKQGRREYDQLLAAQGGVCLICKRPPGKTRLHVDHKHGTTIIRGLLCAGCNIKLGYIEKYLANPEPWDSYLNGQLNQSTSQHGEVHLRQETNLCIQEVKQPQPNSASGANPSEGMPSLPRANGESQEGAD